MNTTLNIFVRTDYGFAVMTRHPKVESVLAKQKCDKMSETGGVFNIETVSTDATTVYWQYGKFVKDIDVHIFLDGKEITFGDLFTSYNESIDYNEEIMTDEAWENMGKYYDEIEESEKS